MYVSAEQLKKETNQQNTTSEAVETAAPTKSNGVDDAVMESKAIVEKITKNNVVGTGKNLELRKEMLAAKGLEPVDFAYERAIGNNDSLHSNFCELIALTKRKVARIVVIENGKKTGFATGFLVSPNLLLTNWHVFQTEAQAIESEVQFFYEYNVNGHPNNPVIFKLDVKKFFANDKGLDYCFVGVQLSDITNSYSLQNINYLYLDKALGKIGDVNKEKLNIIHHPLGDYKQISIRENKFVDIDSTKIYYETDTAQGSSGSPVFNDQWQVVGLHHKSIAKMTPDGKKYLDKNDAIIPELDGKVDISKIVWLKNEGIRISVLLNHLIEKYPNHPLVNELAIAPPNEVLQFNINETAIEKIPTPHNDNSLQNSNNNIHIQIPITALSTAKTIDISFSSKNLNGDTNTTKNVIPILAKDELLEQEKAKVDKEAEVDFSICRGYNSKFLGTTIPLPKPKKEIQKHIAILKNKSTELKYFKYSVIFNASTRMPLLSAINVEGDTSKRLDNSKRSDDWLRDKRIDIETQLTDKFYAGSHFDKGHMSRFEDANWDETEEDALRNGIYTCFYTNACPQVVKLNRAGGLWGKLEKAILENGVKKEDGKLGKITVFNGPIFNAKKDRIFRGVTIPMEFFKVIIWLNDAEEIMATAFKLSQEFLVNDVINFNEAMRIEEEAIDIDQDVVFKEYQLSIKELSKLTKIDFRAIEKWDTYNINAANDDEILLNESLLTEITSSRKRIM